MVPWVMHSLKPKTKKTKKEKKQDLDAQSGNGITEASVPPVEPDPEADKTFHRYYHLYRQGELEHDFEVAGGTVVKQGYERDNWWVVAQRKQD